MLPLGHLSAGYLIAKSSRTRLTKLAVLLITVSALIFDLDFLVLTAIGIPGGLHHFYPGHTPLMVLIYWLIIYLIFHNNFPKKVFIFVALALLSHLIIDDLSYWLTLVGLEKNVPSQINWFYPFIQKDLPAESFTNSEVIRKYLVDTPKLFYLEIVTILLAIQKYFALRKHNT